VRRPVELKAKFDVDGRFCVTATSETDLGTWFQVVVRAEIAESTSFVDFVRAVRSAVRACRKGALAIGLTGINDGEAALAAVRADPVKLKTFLGDFSEVEFGPHPVTADGHCAAHGSSCSEVNVVGRK
jgi:hypothetical protein